MNAMYDYIIVGGGIVGVSTAWQLKQAYPNKSILLLEKESGFAKHQTGHNSGVIHAGVYYAPGSLKADFCKRGVERTIEFCAKHDIPVENCGKLLVATDDAEMERMNALYQRCHDNGIEVELLDAVQLKLAEPNITGLGAILVKTTSIVNYTRVTEMMAKEFTELGGQVSLGTEVIAAKELPEEVQLTCKVDGQTLQLNGRFMITCSGLMADRMTKMLGIETDFQIVPYRGEYYLLDEKHNQVVNHLIYPIPDPELPFLGVHLTRMIDGTVTVGPNAVQGWKREGYGAVNFSLKDTWQMLNFAGFW
ncbi:MAG: L-2-hydroxyglutarate oxidase, partial [Vibrionaceae bacterium]|nr:L-2-hydroxyglutarate oxidase [Vibrionaceae bacterium]